MTAPTIDDDKKLFSDALEALEYATYHDGRYEQYKRPDWQAVAQPLVRRIADRLGRKPYQEFQTGGGK